MSAERHVLITGSSTGIGRACAVHLAQRGWTVHAGVRRETDARSIEGEAPGKITSLMLDVTDAASIAAAAAELGGRVGSAGLTGLVNNAGISVPGPIEVLSTDDWRRQFEVNFFGQIAVTRAMLPLLRRGVEAGGKGAARVVMISSIAGRLGQPILGPYCASKFALEAASDALRLEVRPQGIKVSVVQPGAVKSEIWRKALEQADPRSSDDPVRQRYAPMVAALTELAKKSEQMAIPALRAARVVERCLVKRRPPVRVLVGMDAKMAALLVAVLPTRAMDFLLGWALKVKR